MLVKLRTHQKDALNGLRNGTILWGDVGGGKTRIAAAYYIQSEMPKDVYVITTAKKRDDLDWQTEFIEYGIGRERDGTVGGVLTVDSWNNFGNYKDVRNAFFIFDEQRLVGSGHWVSVFLEIAKHNNWIMLSATPGDNWLDYIPVFLANGFYKNRTQFIREHVVFNRYSKFPKVERYIEEGKLFRLRASILVEMPFERHTTRHIENIIVDYDKQMFDQMVKDRWNPYKDRPLRDVSELFGMMRKIANTSPSRVETVKKLLQRHPKLIVFYNFDYELELLRALAEDTTPSEWDDKVWTEENSDRPSETIKIGGCSGQTTVTAEERGSTLTIRRTPESFAVAEWNGHKHESIPETDSWVYLVQYVAGAEGWNCTETNAMVFYSQTYSYKNHHQAMGRIDRLNTPFTDLYYYLLVSKSLIDIAVSRSLKAKKNFNEARYAKAFS